MAHSLRLTAVCIALLLSLVSLASAKSYPSAGCEKYWDGPSSSNSVEDCLKNQDRNEQWTKWAWIPALPAAVLVITILLYPIVYVCRQCCNMCGGRHRQPGFCCSCTTGWELKSKTEKDSAYLPPAHRCVKCPAFFLFMLSLGVVVVVVKGAAEAESASNAFLEDVEDNGIFRFQKMLTNVKSDLLNSTSGGYYPPADATTFNSIQDMIDYYRDGYDTYRNDYESYVTNSIRIGMNCLGALPFLLLFLLPLYASRDNCRTFWPCATTCLYFLAIIVYSILGILFLVMGVASDISYGEMSRQKVRLPGIFQWYVKPYCQEKALFDSMVDSFTTAEVTYAQQTCLELIQNCSSTTVYSSSFPEKTFRCTIDSSNYMTVCNSYSAMLTVLSGITAKTNSPACTSCSYTACLTACNTAEQQTTVNNTLYLRDASKGYSSAYDTSSSLKNCDTLLDWGVDTAYQGFEALTTSFYLIGSGCFIASFLFAVGIIVLFRGQKVFYKRKSDDAPTTRGAEHSDDEAMDERSRAPYRP